MEHFWMSPATSPMPSQRQRSRKACQPCRQRKRKCDGRKPCTTCVRYEYDCYYSAGERGASDARQEGAGESPYASPTTSPVSNKASGHPGILDPYKTRFVSTSSAIAFPRILGIELNSSSAPRLHSFAWNLGVRPEPRVEHIDLTHYLSFNEYQRLSEVFFAIIHPIFNFIDRDAFAERCQRRYSPGSTERDIDPIICGVAALGSLFSIGSKQSSHAHETKLVELAKKILEHTSTVSGGTLDHVAAWILRTIYLRATTRPHASWLSSCTTMHIIEATGLHQEVSQISIVSPVAPDLGTAELEIRRRLFWVAWSLNTLISYEYGRTRVDLPSMSVEPQGPANDSPTAAHQYIALANSLPGDELNPREADAYSALCESLIALHTLETQVDEIILLKADLAFCIYRRLRLSQVSGSGIPVDATSLIINLGLQALPSSSALAAQHLPWWTVISVPFQLLCVLLAIDSRESLSHVSHAMQALEEVGKHWDTHMVREAVGSAGLLVKLSRKRKEEDLKWLDEGMLKQSGPHGHIATTAATAAAAEGAAVELQSINGLGNYRPGEVNGSSFQIPGITMPTSLNWADGLDVSLPENFNIDWDDFFNTIEWP